MAVPVVLKNAASLDEAALALGVSTAQLRCARTLPNECKENGCRNPALEGNCNKCAWHRQAWWPAKDKAGSLLLGKSFMFSHQAGATNKERCCCGSKTCKDIGYCGRGAFILPTKQTERQAYFDAARLWPCLHYD